MASKTDTTDPMEQAMALIDKAETINDLMAAGGAIKNIIEADGIPEPMVEQLRSRFSQARAELQNMIKIADINGEEVILTAPARYVRTSIGPSFIITGKRSDGRHFEAWAPKPTHRWLESLSVDSYPLRAVFTLGQHPSDPNKSMWTVTELGRPRQARTSGIPF